MVAVIQVVVVVVNRKDVVMKVGNLVIQVVVDIVHVDLLLLCRLS